MEDRQQELFFILPPSPFILPSLTRLVRVRQMRGSTDEGTGAYTVTYVRIPEEGVRSRWRSIASRITPNYYEI